jgi:hypothetical protein
MGSAAHFRYSSPRRLLATTIISGTGRAGAQEHWHTAVPASLSGTWRCRHSVNGGHANRAVGSAQDELLPEVQLASDVGQGLRGTANALEQGNLLGMIEDEVGWPSVFRANTWLACG